VNSSLEQVLHSLGVRRLTHFTPSKNLPHILADGKIRSSKDLAENSPEYFSPTDLERFDRSPHMVCCSFQYPNPYYMAKAKAKSHLLNYPDWVCILLDKGLAYERTTQVSPVNGATAYGYYLRASDSESILSCFARQVGPWHRGPRHRLGVPTDIQAEIHVPGPIELSYLRGIVVPNDEAAMCEWGRLRMLGHEPAAYTWYVAPILFQRDELSARLRFGGPIQETPWIPEEDRNGS
jgi:hypothetical protein